MPAARSLAILLTASLVSGCSWFSWLPFVGNGDDKSRLEPAKLIAFDEEVRIRTEWSAGIGDGLGKKLLTIRPAVAGDRIFAADGYGLVEARNRFSGERVWRSRVGENPKERVERVRSS